MINNEYSNIIGKYVNEMKSNFKQELRMILIIGSSCSEKVIKNWSDIDVILVFDEIDIDTMEKVREIASSYKIKIGITVYNKVEFLSKKIDSKTFYHLYLAQLNEISIHYKEDSFVIPKVSFEEVKFVYNIYLNQVMHVYKRYFLYNDLTKQQVRDFYKSLYILMKTMLIINGYLPKNYEEVFNIYSKEYNVELFDYQKFISAYLDNNDESKEQLLSYSKKIFSKIYK